MIWLGLKNGTLDKMYFNEADRESKFLVDLFYKIDADRTIKEISSIQKDIICQLIDITEQEIYDNLSGETMSKHQAKKYIRDYKHI